jgi:hypothetical protein
MKTRLFFLVLIFAISCNTHPSSQESVENIKRITGNEYDSSAGNFRRFIAKFKIAKLPLVIRPFDDFDIFSRSPIIYGSDSLFIKTEYKDTALDKVYAYRLLPDTLKYFMVIWMEPAESSMPVLTTFSKSGIKISQENLTIGKCGTDCCYSCNEIIIIKPDFSIYAADSIKSCICDSSGPKENTMEKYVLMKTGHITKDGIIQLSEMTRESD